MIHRTYLSASGRKVRARLTSMLNFRPMLRAGLVTMARTCGKKSCRCAKGEKHVSLYLSLKVGRARKMIYVPAALEQAVRSWAGNYREAAALWEKMLQEYLERFLKEKSAVKKSSPERLDRHVR
jgi:hypothetical protein